MDILPPISSEVFVRRGARCDEGVKATQLHKKAATIRMTSESIENDGKRKGVKLFFAKIRVCLQISSPVVNTIVIRNSFSNILKKY